jgi:MFS family permease
LRFQLPDVLRLPDFRNLWLGQAISQLGDAFYYVAFMFMVKKVTGSDVMVGVVGALETLPFLLFGLYAGVLADRVDRRKIMLISDLVCGAVLVGFGLTIAVNGKPPLWALLLAPFLMSSVRCFFMPAKSAALPALVPTNYLLKANALSMTTQNLMPMISLALSAAVLSILFDFKPALFYSVTVFINAVSFLGSAVFIAKLPKILPVREKVEDVHVLADLKDGFRYLRTRRELNVLTAMLAVFRLCVAPFFVVYLAANDAWFGGKPGTIAWFEFSFFAGMVVATALATKINPIRPARWFSFGLGFVGLTVAAMAFTPYFWPFILWNVLAGLAVPIADIPIVTYIQKSVPDAYRGRVNSVRDMVATGVMPVGMGLAGILVKEAGVSTAFLAMGVGMTVACLAGLLDRKFRDVVMPTDEEVPGAAERGLASVH